MLPQGETAPPLWQVRPFRRVRSPIQGNNTQDKFSVKHKKIIQKKQEPVKYIITHNSNNN